MAQTSRQANDPVEMLTQDHRKVEQLFGQFQQAKSAEEKKQIAEQAFVELSMHGTLEKDIFYPAVREAGSQEDKELVEHSYHDHATSEELIAKLKAKPRVDQEYETMFQSLISEVMHHAQEEELHMFPDAEKYMDGGRLSQLGEEMMQAKEQLQAEKTA